MNQNYKILVWLGVVFLLSLGFWRYVDYILNVLTPDSWTFDIEPAGMVNLFVLLPVLSLGTVFFRKKRWTAALGGVFGLSYLLIFGVNWINSVGVVIAIVFLFDSYHAVGEDLSERLKINIRTTLRRGMPRIAMAMAMLISFAAYQSPVAASLAKQERLPTASSQLIYTVADRFVAFQVPDASPSERELVAGEISQIANAQLTSVYTTYNEYAPPALAFALFLVLWSVSWVFVWVSVWAGVGIYALLKALKFIKVEEYDAKAQRMVV